MDTPRTGSITIPTDVKQTTPPPPVLQYTLPQINPALPANKQTNKQVQPDENGRNSRKFI